jgi:protein-L-isoaspartate(D-aspartate) O-methyltransferase
MSADRRGPPFPWADTWPEISDARVRAAFAQVPRDAFVDAAYRRWAERDAPLPIGEGQTISQPFVVALMTQALRPEPANRILEIGTGSGFQTAILCELTAVEDRPAGDFVYSVERYESLAQRAAATLSSLGYAPHIQVGDGAAGWPDEAPFDGIIVTAAARCLPRPLWSQLAPGGRMVIPIGGEYGEQTLWRLEKSGDAMQARALGPVRFVPLISSLLEDPEQCLQLTRQRTRIL